FNLAISSFSCRICSCWIWIISNRLVTNGVRSSSPILGILGVVVIPPVKHISLQMSRFFPTSPSGNERQPYHHDQRPNWPHGPKHPPPEPGLIEKLPVGYASNAVGTINDVRRVVNWAHEVGAWVYVDAV